MSDTTFLKMAEKYQDKDGYKIIILSCQNDFDKFLRPIIYDAMLSFDFTRLSAAVAPRTKLLTVKNIEKEFGIAEKTLEYWRSEGIGPPYIQIGKRVYYERKELEYFIKSCEVRTTGLVDG